MSSISRDWMRGNIQGAPGCYLVIILLLWLGVSTAAGQSPSCTPSAMQPPTYNESSGTVSLAWETVSGAVHYDLRLDDGSRDRYDDSRYATCLRSPHYFCENGITETHIVVPVRPGRIYRAWVTPYFAPPRIGCTTDVIFAARVALHRRSLADRRLLVFSLDQGFGNGIIEVRDEVGLDRVIASLRPFMLRYDVSVLIQTRSADSASTEWIMKALALRNVQFIVDAWASDTLTTGVNAINRPHDVHHGIASTVDALQRWKDRWGPHFAGIRTHEPFSISWTILACKHRGQRWCDDYARWLPPGRYFEEGRLEKFVAFASQNQMLFLLSDSYWHELRRVDDLWDGRSIVRQADNETSLRRVLARYPGVVHVLYANNEGGDLQWRHREVWPMVVEPFAAAGAAGFGLSDQSWMCTGPLAEQKGWDDTNCPADVIAEMAARAFEKGASVVQFEPVWYLWRFPRGEIGRRTDYTNDPAWADRGTPRPQLRTIARSLGVPME
jgi:hypothetical protein